MKYWNNFTKWVRCILIDPLDIRKDLAHINSNTAKFQGDLFHSTKRIEELIKAFHSFDEKVENQLFLEQVNKALHYSVPDMFWVKDLTGRYIKANDSIRKKLLFCEDPIGRDDRSLSNEVRDNIGEDNHTFGSICGSSDLEVLKQERPMKFNEDGLVNGEYMMLQVHKNVVRDTKGNIIATVGIGRDITYEIEQINKAIDTPQLEDIKGILISLLNHYKFTDRS